MRLSSTRIVLSVLFLVSFAVLAGCGGGNTNPGDPGNNDGLIMDDTHTTGQGLEHEYPSGELHTQEHLMKVFDHSHLWMSPPGQGGPGDEDEDEASEDDDDNGSDDEASEDNDSNDDEDETSEDDDSDNDEDETSEDDNDNDDDEDEAGEDDDDEDEDHEGDDDDDDDEDEDEDEDDDDDDDDENPSLSNPVAAMTFSPNPQLINLPVDFTDNGSYDPDGGTIVLFEWDWDNDGVFDDSGVTVSHSWSTPGVKLVQLRVTDDEGATDMLDTPAEVSITDPGTKNPPVAMASASPNPQLVDMPVDFSDNGSFDPDGGSITLYEWDWDNDGVYDATGANASNSWPSPGTYFVQFRVTDDEGDTDTLDTPLEIVINQVNTISWNNDIGPMLGSNCNPCHISSSSGGRNYSTYQNFVNSNVVDLNDPPNSLIIQTISPHNHFGDLTDPQLQTLLDWIYAGIPEN